MSRALMRPVSKFAHCTAAEQHEGSPIPDGVFVGWIIVATISAAYNTAWVRHRRDYKSDYTVGS